MAKRNLGEKIVMTSYDDMFGGVEQSDSIEDVRDRVMDIPMAEIFPFKNHPFKVLDDEKMEEMVESVKQYGVLVPVMVRERPEGGYELLSGHRRQHASTIVGLEAIPAIVKNCNDDEATIIMVDANIQRENISISEKAKAYRMKYDAMKHQGKAGGNTLEEMSETAGESMKTIQRYIYLSNLTEELLDLVDLKKIGVAQGINLSFLNEEEQNVVCQLMTDLSMFVSMEQSERIKEASKQGQFSKEFVMGLMYNAKPAPARKVVFDSKKLNSYFDPTMSVGDIEEIIVKLLDEWKKKGEQS